MLRDAGVRTKLLAVLAIPTLLLVVLTGLLVSGQVSAARKAGQVNALTDVAIQVNRVVHSLQEERSATLGFLQDPSDGNEARMQGQRQYTDQQLRTLRHLVDASPLDGMSAAIQAAIARSTAGHAELTGARRSVDAGRFFATETDVFYTKVIRIDLDLPGVVASSGTTATAQRLQAYEALSSAIEYASHERDIVETAILRGSLTEADYAQAAALVSQQRTALSDFQRYAPAAAYSRLDDALANAENFEIDKVRRDLTDLLRGKEPNYGRSVEWVGATNSRIGPMTDAEAGVVTDIALVASRTQNTQEQRALIVVFASLLGLALALVLAVGLARRITRPLRRLTVAAGEIGEELPRMVERMQIPGEGPGVVVEPIPVESSDEIGRLAAAFNTVNDVTVQVAQEQAALRASIAEMFVNVARRNQVLLGRQLSQLDQMEAREEDPDVLENLYTLDHLATRMRRNAESLLVLAGIDSTRRLRRALPLSDVIRTAVGEIEAYDRIDLSMSEDPDVSGRHALTIAHLLAEVLENATHFSNPETRVVVSAAVTGHGVDLTVTDYGLGMSDEEIVEANEKIAHPPVAEIAVSQRLGLFVVGRLAARLDASVVLRRGRAAGLVVAVSLPTSVFQGLAPEPIAGEAVTPVFEATDEDGPTVVHAPADDDLEVHTAPAEPVDAERTEPEVVPPVAEPVVPPVAVPVAALAEAGEALQPELAASGTAPLPSRRTAAAPAAESATDPSPVASAGLLEPVTDLVAVPAADAAPATDPSLRDAPVAEVPAAREPEGPARRSLFARWSRTPATPELPEGPATADAGPTADGQAEHVDVVEQPVAGDQAVEELAVETPADELPVELEVEMVAAPEDGTTEDTGSQDVVSQDVVIQDVTAEVVAEEPLPPLVWPVDEPEQPAPARAGGLFARWSRGRREVPTPPAETPEVEAVEVAAVESPAVESPAVESPVDDEHAEAVPELLAEPGPEPEAPAEVAEVVELAPAPLVEAASEPLVEVAEVAPAPELVAAVDTAEVAAEPVDVDPEPEPEPVAPVVYAKAVDVLPTMPQRSGGMFGRHRRPAPAVPPVVAASPLAPAWATPAAPAPVPAPRPDLVDDLFAAPAGAASPSSVEPSPAVSAPAPTQPAPSAAELFGALPSREPDQPVVPVGAAPAVAAEPAPVDAVPSRPSYLDRVAAQAELHQSALSELRGLYEPSFAPSAGSAAPTAGLTRRTPKQAEETTSTETAPAAPPRSRTASEVRGMLAGFRAGVERGRGTAADQSPSGEASAADPTDSHGPAGPDTPTR